jgi:hypothetical protein
MGWGAKGSSFGGGFVTTVVLLNNPMTKDSKNPSKKTGKLTKYAKYDFAAVEHPSSGASGYTARQGRLVDEGATLELIVSRKLEGGGTVPSDLVPTVPLRRGTHFSAKRFAAVELLPGIGRKPQPGDVFKISGVSVSESVWNEAATADWSLRTMALECTLIGSSDMADQANSALQLYVPHQGIPLAPIRADPDYDFAILLGKMNPDGSPMAGYAPTKDDFAAMKKKDARESLRSAYYRRDFLLPESREWMQATSGEFFLQLLPTPPAVERYLQSCASVREYVRWNWMPEINLQDPKSTQYMEDSDAGGAGGGGGGGAVSATEKTKPRFVFSKYGTVMRRDDATGEFAPARKFAVQLNMWREALRWYGTEDELAMIYVLPSMFLFTPATLKCYVDVPGAVLQPGVHDVDEEDGVERFSLAAQVSTGTQDAPARGVYVDLAVGIVSGGLEVDAASVLAHMATLEKKSIKESELTGKPVRYRVDMNKVPSEGDTGCAAIKNNVLVQAGSREIVNVLACRCDIQDLAKTHRFFVVSNWWFKHTSMRPHLGAYIGSDAMLAKKPQERAAFFGKVFLECAQGDCRPTAPHWMFGAVEQEDMEVQRDAKDANPFRYQIFALSEAMLKRRGLLDYYGNSAYEDVVCQQEDAALKDRKAAGGARGATAAPKALPAPEATTTTTTGKRSLDEADKPPAAAAAPKAEEGPAPKKQALAAPAPKGKAPAAPKAKAPVARASGSSPSPKSKPAPPPPARGGRAKQEKEPEPEPEDDDDGSKSESEEEKKGKAESMEEDDD